MINLVLQILCLMSLCKSETFTIYRSQCRRDALFKATDKDKILVGTGSGNQVDRFFSRNLAICARGCSKTASCSSINYKANPATLGYENCILMAINKTSAGASLTANVGWIHYEPILQVGPRCRTATCDPGYACAEKCSPTSGHECLDIDECASNPCQNGGTCSNEINKYTCSCAAGYSGTQCERDINECASNPCQNGGTCSDGINQYTCSCAAGYSGTQCQTNIDECASNPCQNGGTCSDGINQYTCSCAAGYSGTQCQTNINECSSNPCQNGGTCSDGVNQYTCSCAAGYSGTQCQTSTSKSSCREWYLAGYRADGTYTVTGVSGASFNVYCHMGDGGWTLVARFSNADAKGWMQSSGAYWYDQSAFGSTTTPSTNADMISRAFYDVKGHDVKVSKSDVGNHNYLLYSGSCLSGTTFRSKVTSYGNFRNNANWLPTNDGCRGSCAINYVGSISGVAGFSQMHCSGTVQSNQRLGFWCHYSSGDGAVLMIGGAGSACNRADHGLGITEANNPIFGSTSEVLDFGDEALGTATTAYALNLWVR